METGKQSFLYYISDITNSLMTLKFGTYCNVSTASFNHVAVCVYV